MHQISIQQPLVTADAILVGRSRTFWVWMAFMAVASVICSVLLLGRDANPGVMAWIIYIAGVVAIFRQPRYGVYFIVFFGLIADKALMFWYPFALNLSSGESLMFLDKSIKFSPLEIYLVLTLISWLLHGLARRDLKFNKGFMSIPALIWAGFMGFGFFTGMTHGGNFNIGLWECRAMFYLPCMVVLTGSTFEKREQLSLLLWLAMLALFIMGGLVGVYTFIFVLHGTAGRIECIVEHAAAVRMNTLFVFAMASHMFKASKLKRVLLPLMCPLVLITYMVSQRRAAYISLVLGIVMIFVVMFIVNRKLFMRIVPVVAIMGIGYLGAFWNNSGTLGLPARAIKSMVVSNGGSAQENSSNEYRVIENTNDIYTVKQAAIMGVGFGHVFYIIAPMPDISFFEWWQYIVHNSIIYIWMKTGIGGFTSMLLMISMALIMGVRALFKMPVGEMGAITMTALLYIFIHYVYAYVDMSWDPQSMLYIGTMMGVLNCVEKIAANIPRDPPLRVLKVWNPHSNRPTEVEVKF